LLLFLFPSLPLRPPFLVPNSVVVVVVVNAVILGLGMDNPHKEYDGVVVVATVVVVVFATTRCGMCGVERGANDSHNNNGIVVVPLHSMVIARLPTRHANLCRCCGWCRCRRRSNAGTLLLLSSLGRNHLVVDDTIIISTKHSLYIYIYI
jgi:hypothetical protein